MLNDDELDTSELVALPPGGDEFLEELRMRLNSEYVRSILFFGSTVTGNVSDSSDIDFIIVLADSAPATYENEVKRLLKDLMDEHLKTSTTPANRLEWMIQRLTGMFQSGFVTSKDHIRAGEFHAIFNTSYLVYCLAPWRTVLAGVFQEAVTVYGEPVAPDWGVIGDPLERSLGELFRSLMMTLLLGWFQVVYSLASDREAIYSQTSYKWAVYDITYHVSGNYHSSLDEGLKTLPDLLEFHGRFKRMRDDPQTKYRYQLLMPIIIFLLHLWAIQRVIRDRQKRTRDSVEHITD